jgi:hypothetical protein
MDFQRAEYVEPQVMDGEIVGQPTASAAFPLALAYGAVAAAVGAVGYALVGLTGFMVSIVVIGIAWLIARGMMTATGGVGGRHFQIAAVILTYFAATCGRLLDIFWAIHRAGGGLGNISPARVLYYAVAGPFLRLSNPINGLLGLLILFFGLRTAWQLAAGSPGFGSNTPGRRTTPFG